MWQAKQEGVKFKATLLRKQKLKQQQQATGDAAQQEEGLEHMRPWVPSPALH